MGTAHLTLTHTTENSTEVINIEQKFTGTPAKMEKRILDWEERTKEDTIFGAVIGKAKRVQVDEVAIEFLKEGWCGDVKENGLIYLVLRGDTSKGAKEWTIEQVWRICSSFVVWK